MLRRLRRFNRYPFDLKLLFIEAFFYLAWGRVFKMVPFAKASSSLGERMTETSFDRAGAEQEIVLRKITKVLYTMSRYTWWESQCMVKAVAAQKMLERRGISSTLYMGSGRDDKGTMIAHAWLRSGSYYVTGNEQLERYAVVACFGKAAGGKKAASRNMQRASE
ncbi:lasso peptide biosynthesis B2 protein [Paenibacillus protaetiae]|uniref:Lasso peptide biosynthesis B2 protein n=1 Tax=Paenibacillus protaetiae TaxID=2509456 RepID=A0A4P6F078_9BACL|nr:lasso peptide biosynthesis B2 protein [Paenibacillus protaetiae]QAY68445.1 lasso peptide biosynthesis B2 protein [Paenibacillus protaetiae]